MNSRNAAKVASVTNKYFIQMRTIEVNIYKFNELSNEAKERAIQECSEINFFDDWYQFHYDDAKEIGIKITSFDLDRNRHCKGEFYSDALECANKILANHGKKCDTYKEAEYFLNEYNSLVSKYSNGIDTNVVDEENEYEFDKEADELEEQFLKDILECYSVALQQESEYLYSDEAIIELIEANEYEFDSEGNRM